MRKSKSDLQSEVTNLTRTVVWMQREIAGYKATEVSVTQLENDYHDLERDWWILSKKYTELLKRVEDINEDQVP